MIRSIRLAAQKELKEKLKKNVELELYVRVERIGVIRNKNQGIWIG